MITFGGHPVATAAALANLDVMKRENMVENAKNMGVYLFEKLNSLKDLKFVGDVRGGSGLLATVELVKNKKTKESFDESKNLYGIMPKFLKENGLLSYRAGDLISVCPHF